MDKYTGFSTCYEKFMDNIPYDKWTEYIVFLLRKYGVEDGLVCELGCGTGSITRRLAKAGYDMIGIDESSDMLEVAMYDHMDENAGILFLNQDMREMELYGTVKAFVCVCDSMNYLLKEEDLVKTFKLANNYLEARGVFIFDMKTEYEFGVKMGNRTIVDNREDGTLIWENRYDPQKKENRYDITVYDLLQDEDGIYERIDETHIQRAYDTEKVKALIEEAGLEFVAAFDAFTMEAPKTDSERVYYIAREKRQEGKLYV
ncbi:MAG: class I SAM-dependent methyltransferase [Lachnospiraceae bacterium]|nr:class I SAM-dependent methyltransferase [Lachnospiraceae bacterium]